MKLIGSILFLILTAGCNPTSMESEETSMAIEILTQYRSAVSSLDFDRATLINPNLANLNREEFPEVQAAILKNFPDPERDKIIFCDASHERIVTVWRYDPGNSEMIYLMPLHFRKESDEWTIDRKGSRTGSGPRELHDEETVLRIQQEVQPELYTLTREKPNKAR